MANQQLTIRNLTGPQIEAFRALFPGLSGATTSSGRHLVTATKTALTIELHPSVPGLAHATPAGLAESGLVLAGRAGLANHGPTKNLLAKLASA